MGNPYGLSLLYIEVCICSSCTPNLSPFFLFGNYKFVLYISRFHIKVDTILYLSFTVWLTSLCIIISGSIHVVAANGIISFFSWLSNIPMCACVRESVCVWERVYAYVYVQIHTSSLSVPSVGEHVGYFHEKTHFFLQHSATRSRIQVNFPSPLSYSEI